MVITTYRHREMMSCIARSQMKGNDCIEPHAKTDGNCIDPVLNRINQ